jgi:hypothetical protein
MLCKNSTNTRIQTRKCKDRRLDVLVKALSTEGPTWQTSRRRDCSRRVQFWKRRLVQFRDWSNGSRRTSFHFLHRIPFEWNQKTVYGLSFTISPSDASKGSRAAYFVQALASFFGQVQCIQIQIGKSDIFNSLTTSEETEALQQIGKKSPNIRAAEFTPSNQSKRRLTLKDHCLLL